VFAIGQDVREVGVEVQQALGAHEVRARAQFAVHHRARRVDSLVARGQPGVEPVVQRVGEVLQEQHEAGGRVPQSLEARTHRR
jgi:hypothetical protein